MPGLCRARSLGDRRRSVMDTVLRQVAGAALMAWGAWWVAWALVHYDSPLVQMPSKLGQPSYFGVSPQLSGFFVGIMIIWCGSYVWSAGWRKR